MTSTRGRRFLVGLLLILVGLKEHVAEASTGGRPRALMGRDMSALKGGSLTVLSGGGDEPLEFGEFLSAESTKNIEVFDRLARGLEMTLEDFFMFINKLLEEGVPDEDEETEGLSVKQLGELFGGVNASAVAYILDTLGATSKDLHAGFNTVDVIMVLMFVSAHMEAGGLPLSLMDTIAYFCNSKTREFDAAVWAPNVARAYGVPQARVHRLMRQLDGGLEDIMGYVQEVVKAETCRIVSERWDKGQLHPPTVTTQPQGSSRLRGNMRGGTTATQR